jgi:hypothetical protein
MSVNLDLNRQVFSADEEKHVNQEKREMAADSMYKSLAIAKENIKLISRCYRKMEKNKIEKTSEDFLFLNEALLRTKNASDIKLLDRSADVLDREIKQLGKDSDQLKIIIEKLRKKTMPIQTQTP